MPAKFQSDVPLGSLTGDEFRTVMKIMGMSVFDLDRAMVGDQPDFYGGRAQALKHLLRHDEGSADLRKAVHATLLASADHHIDFLSRKLRAPLSLKAV